MTDDKGQDSTYEAFYQPEQGTWIEVGSTQQGWMYQKVAAGKLLPLVVMTTSRVHALNYRQFVELVENKPYSEVVAMFAAMAQQQEVTV